MNDIIKKISVEFSQGNFEFAYPYMADEIRWNMLGSFTVSSKAAVIAKCNKMQAEMAGAILNNTNHIVGNDTIAVEGYCNYTGDDGKPGKVAYCDIYKFNNEQLTEISSYCIEIKQPG